MSGENLSANSESEQSYASTGVEDLAAMPDFFKFRAEQDRASTIERLKEGATTASVYIEGGSSMSISELKRKKGDPEAYTKERQAWHERVLTKTFEFGKHLSDELGPPPRIIAARGGCGAGKTTAFKKLFQGKNIFNEKSDIPGAVKPDYFKDVIKDEARDSLGIEITSDQTHMESTGLCRMYAEELKSDPNTSMVIDKQLETAGDIQELIEWGHETGKPVELLDNDVPIELSAYRVLKRPIGGADPNMQFSSVARGFIGIRANRAELLSDIKDDIVSFYSLRAFDPVSKDQVPIVQKNADGKIVYVPGYEELGRSIIRQGEAEARAEASQVEHQLITEEYIESFVSKYFDESESAPDWSRRSAKEAREVLGAYVGLGITFGEAMASKAAGINPDKDPNTGELIDPNYRDKIISFVNQQRTANASNINQAAS